MALVESCGEAIKKQPITAASSNMAVTVAAGAGAATETVENAETAEAGAPPSRVR